MAKKVIFKDDPFANFFSQQPAAGSQPPQPKNPSKSPETKVQLTQDADTSKNISANFRHAEAGDFPSPKHDTVKKTYRIPADVAAKMWSISSYNRCSINETVTKALEFYLQQKEQIEAVKQSRLELPSHYKNLSGLLRTEHLE